MSKKNLTYTIASQELDEILSQLQNEDIDVDELSVKVKRAMELIRFCKEKITKTEMEVKKVIKEFEEEFAKEEIEAEEEGGEDLLAEGEL